ncbi:MAG: lamin tail domain-containing protein, partial [Bacteroidota bacterium]
HLLVFVLITVSTYAQFTDSFDDEDFSQDPQWLGDAGEFQVDINRQLRLNNLAPGSNNESHLSVASSVALEAVWEFQVGFDGLSSSGLSNSNKMLVYLVSDQANLESDPQGYYVQIGGTQDEISLYSTLAGKLIDGPDGVTASSSGLFSIKVTRSQTGEWELQTDNSGGQNLSLVGTAVNTDFISSSFFGVLCDYTTTRSTNFFFDDFEVFEREIVDQTPPSITKVDVLSATEIQVFFNEQVLPASASEISNYQIAGINILEIDFNPDQADQARLTVSKLENLTTYQLTVNNLEDLSGNQVVGNTSFEFTYLLIGEAEFQDIVINEFLAAPNDEGGLPNAEFIELFNASDKVINLESYTISDNSGSSAAFDSCLLLPNHYLIVTASGNVEEFTMTGEVKGLGNFRALNNSGDAITLLDADNEIIANIEYSSSQAGVSLELVNPFAVCISSSNYLNSSDPSGGTPGTINSVFDDQPDLEKPTLLDFQLRDNTLQLNFSEVMDITSLSQTENYSLSNLSIEKLIVNDDNLPQSALLIFEGELIEGATYTLTIQDLTDCSGNSIDITSIDFGKGKKPLFNEILITEILYDELPSIGLPEREYIEIYNNSSSILTSRDVLLTDALRTIPLPEFDLFPNQFLVLTANSGADEFPNAQGVSNFPSLSNTGEELILSHQGDLVFSIKYESDWQQEDRSEGGYSLEMVDFTNPCLESGANWRSATAPIGGTPGQDNSVRSDGSNPDSFGPELLKIVVLAADTIELSFSEKIQSSNLEDLSVEIQPSTTVDSVFLDFLNPTGILLVLGNELLENQEYILLINRIRDCVGNKIEESEMSFALPVEAMENEVLLSEVLFNPRSQGVDFVELYNNSDNFLTLQNWRLARLTDEGIADEKVLSERQLVFEPHSYLVLTSDIAALSSSYPQGDASRYFEMDALPAYANDTGNVVLMNTLEMVQQRFFYDEDFHYPLLESVDGVSLERISFDEEVNNPSNWRSSASMSGFATPGRPNSQSLEKAGSVAKLSVNPKVFVPGNSGSGRDFTTINYQFDEPGKFANIRIYDQNGRIVKTLMEGASLQVTGFVQWNGLNDNGSLAKIGHHIILMEVYDSSGSNEVLKETVVVGRNF